MYIDAHTHMAKYEENLSEAINEIVQNEIISVSVSMDTFLFEKNLRIADSCGLVIPCFGIHPWTATHYSYKLNELIAPLKKSMMIGEVGLDFHFVEETEQYLHQRKVFEFILESAAEMHKILNIHTKGAEKEVLAYLRKHKIKNSIIHWYSGPVKYINDFLELGCYFTFGVELLENKKITKILRQIPGDRILAETDNPGGYEWLKGEKGMPQLIINVVEKLAELIGEPVEDTKIRIQTNFLSLIENDRHITREIKNKVSGLLY